MERLQKLSNFLRHFAAHCAPELLAGTDEAFAPSEEEGAELPQKAWCLSLPSTLVTKMVSVSSPQEEP